jgi:hypothetical protein
MRKFIDQFAVVKRTIDVTPGLVTCTSMRSVVVVLYLARYCFPGTDVYVVLVVYLALMIPQIWLTIWRSPECTSCGGRMGENVVQRSRPSVPSLAAYSRVYRHLIHQRRP